MLTVAGGSVSVAVRLLFGGSAAAEAAAAKIISARSNPSTATAWFAISGYAAESLTHPVVAATPILVPSPPLPPIRSPSLPAIELHDSLMSDYAPAFVFQVHRLDSMPNVASPLRWVSAR